MQRAKKTMGQLGQLGHAGHVGQSGHWDSES